MLVADLTIHSLKWLRSWPFHGLLIKECVCFIRFVVADEKLVIPSPPKVLAIGIQQAAALFGAGTYKDAQAVGFGSQLDLSHHTSSAGPRALYKLVGAAVHKGKGTESGHYYNFAKLGKSTQPTLIVAESVQHFPSSFLKQTFSLRRSQVQCS